MYQLILDSWGNIMAFIVSYGLTCLKLRLCEYIGTMKPLSIRSCQLKIYPRMYIGVKYYGFCSVASSSIVAIVAFTQLPVFFKVFPSKNKNGFFSSTDVSIIFSANISLHA